MVSGDRTLESKAGEDSKPCMLFEDTLMAVPATLSLEADEILEVLRRMHRVSSIGTRQYYTPSDEEPKAPPLGFLERRLPFPGSPTNMDYIQNSGTNLF